MQTLGRKTVRALATGFLALTLLVGASLTAAPANAAPKGPTESQREDIVQRAQRWADKKVPYSQQRYVEGYRADCSGFVSMAWGLDESMVTWTLSEVAHRIEKEDLRPGDVLLNGSAGGSGRHAVVFKAWANRDHTKYIALEQSGQVDRAIERVVEYPYLFDGERYEPYRLNAGVGIAKTPGPKQVDETARAEAAKAEEARLAEEERKAAEERVAARRHLQRGIVAESVAAGLFQHLGALM